MKIFFVIACAVTALSGCVSEQPATGQELTGIQTACRNYGFKPGSEQYTACIYDMDQRRISANRDRRLRFARSMSMMGAGIQAQNNMNALNRPISTTCSRNGYYTNCTSF